MGILGVRKNEPIYGVGRYRVERGPGCGVVPLDGVVSGHGGFVFRFRFPFRGRDLDGRVPMLPSL